MASTYTDIGTELMTTGENAGNWGTKTNTNLKIIEEAVRGYVAQSIAGGADTTALTYTDGSTGDAARNMVIALTGTITGNQVVTVTAKEKVWIVDNQTSGAYTVQFMVSGQTGVTWGTSDKGTKILYCNGTDVIDTGITSAGAFDLDGNELILDADADTSITADTDDQIDIKIANADHIKIATSSGDTVIQPMTDAKDIIIKQYDGTELVNFNDGAYSSFTSAALNPEATLTDGATPAWNALTQPVAKITIAGYRTIGAASGGVSGQFISLLIIQDGTGSRTMTWNAAYEFKDDTAPTLTTTAAKGDLFVFRYNGAKWLEVGRNQNLTLS